MSRTEGVYEQCCRVRRQDRLRKAAGTVTRWRGLYKFGGRLSRAEVRALESMGIGVERTKSVLGPHCYTLWLRKYEVAA